jgi:hypothetical protein
MRIDPAIVADEEELGIPQDSGRSAGSRTAGSTSDDIHAAFGG